LRALPSNGRAPYRTKLDWPPRWRLAASAHRATGARQPLRAASHGRVCQASPPDPRELETTVEHLFWVPERGWVLVDFNAHAHGIHGVHGADVKSMGSFRGEVTVGAAKERNRQIPAIPRAGLCCGLKMAVSRSTATFRSGSGAGISRHKLGNHNGLLLIDVSDKPRSGRTRPSQKLPLAATFGDIVPPVGPVVDAAVVTIRERRDPDDFAPARKCAEAVVHPRATLPKSLRLCIRGP